jgi:hypothetical protein
MTEEERHVKVVAAILGSVDGWIAEAEALVDGVPVGTKAPLLHLARRMRQAKEALKALANDPDE